MYLDVKSEKKLLDVILSKSLSCLAIFGAMSEIFVKRIEFANISFLMTNHKMMIERFAKPLILYSSSRLILGLYVVIIFFAVLATFIRTKENKNMITLVTFLCFSVSFLIFSCCPYFIICYSSIFLPGVLGLFVVISSIKELSPNRRKEKNIKAGKFKFVMCIITLVLIIINIIGNAIWIVFGREILKFYLELSQNSLNK